MTKLHITHIDAGVAPVTSEDLSGMVFDDPLSGRWPKVSFSDGTTLTYVALTNTKVLFLTARNRFMVVNNEYNELVAKFLRSNKPFNESNWRTQKQREVWTPTDAELGRILA